MTAHISGRAWLLGEFRRVEWRRLLLAVALLSAWGRALVPLPAQATVEIAGAVMCAMVGTASGPDGLPTEEHGARSCALCRLPDLPDGLIPETPIVSDVRFLAPASPPRLAAALCVHAVSPHPPVRGPPVATTTI